MARSTSLLFVALGPVVATPPFVEIWLPQCRRSESDPFPPPRSRGVQRDPLGPRSQNRRRISGWELESQIRGHPPSEGSGQGACRAASLSRLQLTRKWPVSYPG